MIPNLVIEVIDALDAISKSAHLISSEHIIMMTSVITITQN